MSSGAVAASDPGGGEPKLVAGADVEMTDAKEEEVVVAPAAGVKVERESRDVGEGAEAAVAMDVEQGGGDVAAAVSDLLYATESAGMVAEEGSVDELTEGVNGGGGSEEKVQVGAGGLPNEAERKPVLAGDVAAPTVAGQAVEAAGFATPETTVADTATENKEMDNGVAHFDNEVQNNVPGDVEGSSKIYQDDGAPAVDQPDGTSEMLPETVEHVPDSGTNPSSSGAARYRLPPLDSGGFRVSDLVWGKVKSHPWWPGEIFDPSDASDLALKHRKKDSHLVAYFGDSTFAWCDESQLKPFMTNYSQMEKQSTSDPFVGSINNALEELSRRILSGMSCSCLPEELADSGMSYMVENAGLKDGVTCSAVNRFEILKCFSPENLLHYIKELALFPGQGGDLLELVVACSQLTSFYRSKGCSELASFQSGDGWVEDGMDTPSIQNVMVEEAVISEVQPAQDKPKRGRGRPRKQKPEYDKEVIGKKDASNLNNHNSYHATVERQMGMEFDDFDNLESKKKRNLDSFEDSEKSSTIGSSFKIGECIRRAASQLAGSSSIVKAQNEPTVHKSPAEAENGEFDIVSDDADDELTVLSRAKRRRMYRNHNADPNELLSQLCIAATEPMNGHSFSAMIISYFSDYRNYVVSTATEASIVEKSTSKRGRKRKVLPSPEVETTDHMQDSYWSGLSLHNHPIHNLRNESSNTRPRRRRRSSRQTYVPLSELGGSPKKQIQVTERSIIHVEEKMVDELKPTALVLSFGRAAHVPSETDITKMFSRYGPLKESETEVDKDTNTVKVVFKKRSDAERAFSAAGKYGTFGPSLRSYRLVNMPFSLKASTTTTTTTTKKPETHSEDRGPDVSGPSESNVSLDAMQIDQVDKTDKAVGEEPAAEQVETAKQTSQMETAGAQTESVAEGSSEQDSTVERACTQKESSVEGVSETTQDEAAAGAPNGSMISEIELGEAPNQVLFDETTNTVQMEAASKAQPEDTVKQVLHADATDEASAQVVSDNTQTNTAAEAPEKGHISEVPTDTEADNVNQVPEEGMVSLEPQSQTSNEKPVEQDAVEQKVGSEAPKQVSGEAPCSSKLDAETAEPTGLDSIKQVEQESQTVVEVSDEQANSIKQSIQVEAITETPGEQIEAERQTPEDECMADATMEASVTVEQTLDSKVEVPVEESVDDIVGVPAQVKETAEKQTVVEAIDEKIENKAAAEALGGETLEGEMVTEVSNEKTENKAAAEASAGKTEEGQTAVQEPEFETENKVIVEPLARENAASENTAEAPDEETRTAKEAVEDVSALPEKTTTDDKTLENDSTVTPVEKTTTAEETEDAKVETSDDKTLEGEKTVEDATVGAPASTSEKTTEDTMVDAPGVQAGASEQTG